MARRKRRKKPTKTEKLIKFSKIAVITSIIALLVYTGYALYMQTRYGIEVSPTLTDNFFRTFGTELLCMAMIKIFEKVFESKHKNDTEQVENPPTHSDINRGV